MIKVKDEKFKVKLIDFDFSGTHNVSLYPPFFAEVLKVETGDKMKIEDDERNFKLI